jgi:II/X family phage/plasmid replication protein
LIDWLSLRFPIDDTLTPALYDRIRNAMNTISCVDSLGEVVWTKKSLDLDAIRSDTVGLCWMLQSDGKRQYLSIGASPASLEHGINVFGSCDIHHCAGVLIHAASKALGAILPPPPAWQCRRIDVTGNFALPDYESVKQALRQLSLADGGRRKATNKTGGGDTVYWNPTSDLAKGKAYHKGPQLEMLRRKGAINCNDNIIKLANCILRLEHTRGARWFRDLAASGKHWYKLKTETLEQLFTDFFGRLVDGVEVTEMNRKSMVDRIRDANNISEGRAQAAFTTYRNIRQDGFEVVKGYMPSRTWYLHLKHLRAAGISDVQLQQGNVVQFHPVRIILARPVCSWDDMRYVA